MCAEEARVLALRRQSEAEQEDRQAVYGLSGLQGEALPDHVVSETRADGEPGDLGSHESGSGEEAMTRIERVVFRVMVAANSALWAVCATAWLVLLLQASKVSQ